jgi:hypothetical protein
VPNAPDEEPVAHIAQKHLQARIQPCGLLSPRFL